MKTAKKLFSLLLVAVLLMSAIPFQASATELTDAEKMKLDWYVAFYDDAWNKLADVKLADGGDNYKVLPAGTQIPVSKDASKKIVEWKVKSTPTNDIGNRKFYINEMTVDGGIAYVNAVAVVEAVHNQHNLVAGTPVAATCTTDGYTDYTCDATLPNGSKCTYTERKDTVPASGHKYGEWEVVTAAQIGVAGLEKRECEREGCNQFETRAIAALEAPKTTVTFVSTESGETFTRDWEQYKLITELPAPKDVRNKRFDGWYTQTAGGERIQVGNTWSGQYTTYYARFIDSVKDNVSNVSVFVRFYSEGIQQGETIFLDSFELTDNDKLLPALQARQSAFATKIYNIKSSNDYLWNESFYMYASGEKITDSDMRIDGDTSILLKVDAKKSAKANVLLYVHNKAGEAATRLYEMNGYTAGNTVTSAAVQNFLKAQTGKTYTISGLYDQDRWEQLANGQKPTAAGGLDVPTSGTLKIHVILSNFSSSTSSKPASNPSTGDPIMATAGIMVLAAAALVSILELRKRKMI